MPQLNKLDIWRRGICVTIEGRQMMIPSNTFEWEHDSRGKDVSDTETKFKPNPSN